MASIGNRSRIEQLGSPVPPAAAASLSVPSAPEAPAVPASALPRLQLGAFAPGGPRKERAGSARGTVPPEQTQQSRAAAKSPAAPTQPSIGGSAPAIPLQAAASPTPAAVIDPAVLQQLITTGVRLAGELRVRAHVAAQAVRAQAAQQISGVRAHHLQVVAQLGASLAAQRQLVAQIHVLPSMQTSAIQAHARRAAELGSAGAAQLQIDHDHAVAELAAATEAVSAQLELLAEAAAGDVEAKGAQAADALVEHAHTVADELGGADAEHASAAAHAAQGQLEQAAGQAQSQLATAATSATTAIAQAAQRCNGQQTTVASAAATHLQQIGAGISVRAAQTGAR